MKLSIAPEHHMTLHNPAETGSLHTGINMSQIKIGGGTPGFIFAAGTVYIFFVGVPALRWFLVWAIVAGSAISIALRLFHKFKPTRPLDSISR